MAKLREGLIEYIADDLGIHKDNMESDQDYRRRLVYSASACRMLSSFWDKDEDGFASVQHCKATVDHFISDMKRVFGPDCVYGFQEDDLKSETYSELLYDGYISAGYVYHKANYVRSSLKRNIAGKGIVMKRGVSPFEIYPVSGMCPYEVDGYEMAIDDVCVSFDLRSQSWKDYIEEFIAIPECNFFMPSDTKYLKMGDFKSGYWDSRKPSLDGIYLARCGMQPWDYYLICNYDNVHNVRHLGNTRLNKDNKFTSSGYLRIAASLLMLNDCMPKISYVRSNELTYVRTGYMLPPNEQTFYKLLSWPNGKGSNIVFDSEYRRCMSNDVFLTFKGVLERQGFVFEEGRR